MITYPFMVRFDSTHCMWERVYWNEEDARKAVHAAVLDFTRYRQDRKYSAVILKGEFTHGYGRNVVNATGYTEVVETVENA